MEVALASALREGTKAAQTMAENTDFLSSSLKGVVDLSSYRNLVAAIGKVLFVDSSVPPTRWQHRRCGGLRSFAIVRFEQSAA